jgi:hypothetical protein
MASGVGSRSKKASRKQGGDRADQVDTEADASYLRQEAEDEEKIDEDHLCPICQLLLFRPVTTSCNHTLCESCTLLSSSPLMPHWSCQEGKRTNL